MAIGPEDTLAQAKAVAEAVRLDLPEDRLESLAKAYSAFLEAFEEVRKIDPGDREPAAFVPAREEQP